MADNADRAAEQQDVIHDAILRRRPRNPMRPVMGSDCMECGDQIPAERMAAVRGACLCVDCQEAAELAMGR